MEVQRPKHTSYGRGQGAKVWYIRVNGVLDMGEVVFGFYSWHGHKVLNYIVNLVFSVEINLLCSIIQICLLKYKYLFFSNLRKNQEFSCTKHKLSSNPKDFGSTMI